jgi:hypothetical protein
MPSLYQSQIQASCATDPFPENVWSSAVSILYDRRTPLLSIDAEWGAFVDGSGQSHVERSGEAVAVGGM